MSEKKSYQSLKQQLDTILSQLQQDDVDLDEAVTLHKEGQKILLQLNDYLQHVADESGLEVKKLDA